MPSFLSKVFGRKKDDKESPRSPGHVYDPSLLEGKFESVSPSATKFPEVANEPKGAGQGKEKDKDSGFTLFKMRSRPASPDTTQKRIDIPHLSLNLSDLNNDSNSRPFGVVFEGDFELLSESVIGDRRLSPSETLALVHACSQSIVARGLESLGIMHPHWYSASPDVQRRLISLFIQSLTSKSPITAVSPSPSAFGAAFDSEISSTRSPHDVAAVLRWGLRHLELEGSSFGREDTWYKSFLEAERSSGYPPNAFSVILGPQLPSSHLQLLTAILEIFSSLAAHAEANGISGSKLSKFLGLWLLTSNRAYGDDDWSTFYARWQHMGRIMEHLFLSRIRDEATASRLPTRLLELVHQYPYSKSSTSPSDSDFLPCPRFTTRRYDALFVRVEAELSTTAAQQKPHPLQLIADAFRAESTTNGGTYEGLWEAVKKAGKDEANSSPGGYPTLNKIFSDETIRFLSLISTDGSEKGSTSPSFTLSVESIMTPRRRSFSLSDRDKNIAHATTNNGSSDRDKNPTTDPAARPSNTDWAEFSAAGFTKNSPAGPLAATLINKEKDMEVTLPKSAVRSKGILPQNGRKSLDTSGTATRVETPKSRTIESSPILKSTSVSLVQLDEAFIDFWSDALLDPISSNWPAFVICKLKTTLPGMEVEGKRLEWLVVEQTFKRPSAVLESPNTATTTSPDSARRPRASSPKPSFKSDLSFSSARKRFSFFASGGKASSSEKASKSGKKGLGQSPRVGEMGEILAEEDEEKVDNTIKLRVPSPKPKKSVDVPRKSGETPKKSIDTPRKSAEVLKKSTDIFQQPVETPKKSIDNGRAGPEVSGLAAAVAVAAVGTGMVATSTPSSNDVKPVEPETKVLSTNGSAIETPTPAVGIVPSGEPSIVALETASKPTENEVSPVSNGSAANTHEAESFPVPVTGDKSLDVDESLKGEPVNTPQLGDAPKHTILAPVVTNTPDTQRDAPGADAPTDSQFQSTVPINDATLAPPVVEQPSIADEIPESAGTVTEAGEPTRIESEAPELADVPTEPLEESDDSTVIASQGTGPEPASAEPESMVPQAMETAAVPTETATEENVGPSSIEPRITEAVIAPTVYVEANTESVPSHAEVSTTPGQASETTGSTKVPEISEEAGEPESITSVESNITELPPIPAKIEAPAQETPAEPPVPNNGNAHTAETEAPTEGKDLKSDGVDSHTVEESRESSVATPTVHTDVGPTETTAAPLVDEQPEGSPAYNSEDVDQPPMHSEPLHVPENDAGDNNVTLPAVPVVEVEPVHAPVVEVPAPVVDEIVPAPEPAPIAEETNDNTDPSQPTAIGSLPLESPIENVIHSGDTPGPQAILDNILQSSESKADEPVHAKPEPTTAIDSASSEAMTEPTSSTKTTGTGDLVEIKGVTSSDVAEPSENTVTQAEFKSKTNEEAQLNIPEDNNDANPADEPSPLSSSTEQT